MKLVDLIAQLNASADLHENDNPEVIVTSDEEDETEILEVSYNTETGTVDILIYDRGHA